MGYQQFLKDVLPRIVRVSDRPKRMLMIGAGLLTLSRLVNNNSKVTVIEVDETLVKYLESEEGKRITPRNVSVVLADGASWIKSAVGDFAEFDLILFDAFVGFRVPESLIEHETISNAVSLLSSDGVFIANTILPEQADELRHSLIEVSRSEPGDVSSHSRTVPDNKLFNTIVSFSKRVH